MAAFLVSSSNFKHKDLDFLNQGFTLLFTNWIYLFKESVQSLKLFGMLPDACVISSGTAATLV